MFVLSLLEQERQAEKQTDRQTDEWMGCDK